MNIHINETTPIIGVYKIINSVNNKCYIGSSNNILQRLRNHKRALLNNNHINKHLQNAYNLDCKSFYTETLEVCEIEFLREREQFYIDNLLPEYNIAQSVYNYIISEETKIKISDTLRTRYLLGNISKSHTTKIKVFDLNCSFIKFYNSIREASNELGVRYHSIQKVLKKEFKHTKGYQFLYLHEEDPIEKLIIQNNRSNTRRHRFDNLFIYDLKTKDTYIVDTLIELSNILKCSKSSIVYNIKNRKCPFKQRYIILPIARLKLDKLLGSLEADNQQPTSANDVKVTEKVQRLDSEESTNNLSTKIQPEYKWIKYDDYNTLKKWFDNHPMNIIKAG